MRLPVFRANLESGKVLLSERNSEDTVYPLLFNLFQDEVNRGGIATDDPLYWW